MSAVPTWVDDVVRALPALMTTDEAAQVLRTTRRNLYRWISAGKLLAIKSDPGDAGRVLVPRTAVAALLRSMEAA